MGPVSNQRKRFPRNLKLVELDAESARYQNLALLPPPPGFRTNPRELSISQKDRASGVFDVPNSVRPQRMPMVGNTRASREAIGAAHAPQPPRGYIARELAASLCSAANRPASQTSRAIGFRDG
jgi:hypothetical protein